jgi:hypothetical protein
MVIVRILMSKFGFRITNIPFNLLALGLYAAHNNNNKFYFSEFCLL